MFSKVFVALFATSASAAVIQVAVGGTGANTLTFQPNTVNAQPGDSVQFNFRAANHSVVSASPNNPCNPGGATAIFSDFQPVGVGKATPQFTVPVTNTQATYIYCSQTKAPSHCQAGMVMIINPPNANAINQLMAAAAASGPSTSPPGSINGGSIVNNAAGTNPSKLVGVKKTKAKAGAKAKAAAAKAKAKAAKAKAAAAKAAKGNNNKH